MIADIRRIRTLTLRGRKWKIRWLEKVFDHLGKHEVYGLCDRSASTISLSLNQPPSEFADTLIHELLHALFNAREKRIRSGATELLDALRRVGLCPKGKCHEARNRARAAATPKKRNRRIAKNG